MSPRIVYLSWPAKEITGGIKLAFRHVEILREAGFDAIIATPDGQPPQWFETTAPVADLSTLVRGEDALVFPENHHGLLKQFAAWPNRKTVFCQSYFMTFRGLGGKESYADFGVSAILAVSRQVAEFCRRRFPTLPTTHVPVFIDHRLFHFQSEKRLQIVFAPRKRPQEAAFIRDLFQATYPEFRKLPWVEVAGVAEQKVAELLKQSTIYLSLCRFEALPLSILEAFACGCVVAGFTGFGAREYITVNNGFWAAEDDCLDCVEQLARAVRLVAAGGSMHGDMLEVAHLAANYYNRERLARRLVEFWRAFFNSAASGEAGAASAVQPSPADGRQP